LVACMASNNTRRGRIGDWWNHLGHAYGARLAVVAGEVWIGPAYSSCANVASVCDKFERSRHRTADTEKTTTCSFIDHPGARNSGRVFIAHLCSAHIAFTCARNP
jgi:hypothetical protein